jgi:hypothetical protein
VGWVVFRENISLLRIQKPTVMKQGRDFRLTDVFGDVIKPLLG